VNDDLQIGGKLLLGQSATFVSPTLSLNLAWGGGAAPIFSRLGRWTGNVNGANIILRVAFALADYGTANSIGELTLHYTLGRTQPCTNAPSTLCYGDGFVLSTNAAGLSRNIYVVPVSYSGSIRHYGLLGRFKWVSRTSDYQCCTQVIVQQSLVLPMAIACGFPNRAALLL
jgi:hypothetical protein